MTIVLDLPIGKNHCPWFCLSGDMFLFPMGKDPFCGVFVQVPSAKSTWFPSIPSGFVSPQPGHAGSNCMVQKKGGSVEAITSRWLKQKQKLSVALAVVRLQEANRNTVATQKEQTN